LQALNIENNCTFRYLSNRCDINRNEYKFLKMKTRTLFFCIVSLIIISCNNENVNPKKTEKEVEIEKVAEKEPENTIETEVTLVMQEYGYSGLGTYISENGDKYVGEWKKGKQDGHGTLTFKDSKGSPDGGYVGEWKNGKFHGNGTYTLKENYGSYDGEFKNGLYDGQGTYIFDWKQRCYKGEFKNGQWHGQAVLFYLPNPERPYETIIRKGRWFKNVPAS
jgi:hypothetical protein